MAELWSLPTQPWPMQADLCPRRAARRPDAIGGRDSRRLVAAISPIGANTMRPRHSIDAIKARYHTGSERKLRLIVRCAWSYCRGRADALNGLHD